MHACHHWLCNGWLQSRYNDDNMAWQVSGTTGPLARELLRSIAECSTQQCSGHGRCRQLPSLPGFPPLPAPPGCLRTCDATPCGRCVTGCPPDEKACKLPSGQASSRNLCLCNEHHTQCRGNISLCPPHPVPPAPAPVPRTVACVCDPGYTGAHCKDASAPAAGVSSINGRMMNLHWTAGVTAASLP